MIRVTAKDRIFLAIVLPAALLAIYAIFVHAPLAKRLCAMRDRYATLGTVEEIEAERPHLEARRRKAAAARAASEKAEADRMSDESGGKTVDADSLRFDRMMTLLGDCPGVRIVSAERITGYDAAETRPKELVRDAAGIAEPALWRFTANADYASVMKALCEIRDRKTPAIVEGISFEGSAGRGGSRTWRIDVWL